MYTVNLVYNAQPWDPKIVAVVDSWSLFSGNLFIKKFQMGPQNSGRYRHVVAIRKWSLVRV
jgi:hypothetical protein